jgi:hypothetical protein
MAYFFWIASQTSDVKPCRPDCIATLGVLLRRLCRHFRDIGKIWKKMSAIKCDHMDKVFLELARQGNSIEFGVNVLQPLMTSVQVSNGTGKSIDK